MLQIFIFVLAFTLGYVIHKYKYILIRYFKNGAEENSGKKVHVEHDIAKILSENRTFNQQREQALKNINQIYLSTTETLKKSEESIPQVTEASDDNQKSFQNISNQIVALKQATINCNENFEKLSKSSSEFKNILIQVKEVQVLFESISEDIAKIESLSKSAQMISFNATLEAERAGEAGKGFTTIASSIRNLSIESQKLTTAIFDTLEQKKHHMHKLSSNVTQLISENTNVSDTILVEYHKLANNIDELKKSNDNSLEKFNNFSSIFDIFVNQAKTSLETVLKVLIDSIGIISGSSIKDLKPSEAFDLISEFNVIDVRRPEEFNGDLGHVNGAKLLTLQDNYEIVLNEHLDKELPYLFICRSGGRSAKAARTAQMEGFKKVYNLSGGMLNWNEQNLPVTRN